MANRNELLTRVYRYISLHQEGESWDFKRQWHDNAPSLLHDIICMANLLSSEDGLIIIGVDEENDYQLCDVTHDTNRKNTQKIVTFLRDKKFAYGIRPTVYVECMTIDSVTVDVIVVQNSRKVPYYLSEDFQGIKAHHIYTRIMDTNTPKDKSADPDVVEKLWRKHFALDQSALDKIKVYLDYPDDWISVDGDMSRYYKYAPEYTIVDIKDETSDGYVYYLFSQMDPKPHWYDVRVKCHQTDLFVTKGIALDGGRAFTVCPDYNCFSIETDGAHCDTVSFYSYTVGTLRYSLHKFFFGVNHTSSIMDSNKLAYDNCIPVFWSEQERDAFTNYAKEHFDLACINEDDYIPSFPRSLETGQDVDVFREEYCTALKMINLLYLFRNSPDYQLLSI